VGGRNLRRNHNENLEHVEEYKFNSIQTSKRNEGDELLTSQEDCRVDLDSN